VRRANGRPAAASSINDILAKIEVAGMETRPYWNLSFDGTYSIGNAMHLLTRLSPEDRPDSLVISDDNLVEAGLTGVVASGVKVPDDLEVVVHCNFPNPPAAILHVKKIGFDCRELLHVCCNLIDMQRRGEPVPLEVQLPAICEDELGAPTRHDNLSGNLAWAQQNRAMR